MGVEKLGIGEWERMERGEEGGPFLGNCKEDWRKGKKGMGERAIYLKKANRFIKATIF